MKEKVSIDRFEGELAVLLVGETDRVVIVPRKQLPNGVKEGAWLLVEFEDNKLVSAENDPEEAERARKRIMEKLERLRRGDHRT